jgi:hypothetical protein
VGWDHIAEARALFERTNDAPGLVGTVMSAASVALNMGDPERACELLCSGVEGRVSLMPWFVWWEILHAEAALAVGKIGVAEGSIATAREVFTSIGDQRGLRRLAELEQQLESVLRLG